MDWSTANSARVQQWICHGGTNQRWRIEPLTDGTSRIVNLHSGKALDVAECTNADGTNVRLWTWLNNGCQQFKPTS